MDIDQREYNVAKQNGRIIHTKINILNFDFQLVDEISGVVLDGSSYNIDATSDIRRTCNISLIPKDKSFNVEYGAKLWMDKYIQVFIGIEDTSNNPLQYLHLDTRSSINPQASDLRKTGTYMESKLYHSEFFQPTYYYDSFAFKFELEKLYVSDYVGNYSKTDIKFLMTSTINSKFMFTFDNYDCGKANQNYSKYLPVIRNNEEVLYNVAYVNYVRSGFNYDIKSKAIQSTSNALGVSLSALSVGASLLIPSAPLKVAGVVGSLVSLAMSVKNAVISEQQADNSIKQKIEQYKNQTTSVAGSDDVDLMSEYAKNRLQYLEYAPRPNTEKLLYDLFFYAGYRSDRMGIPTHNNRTNFDYLECDASIECLAGGISQECIQEIINCYKNGVTYIHKNDSRVGNRWDLEQKYENWEKILM